MNGSLTYSLGSTNDLKIGMSDQRPPSKPRKRSEATVPTSPAISASLTVAHSPERVRVIPVVRSLGGDPSAPRLAAIVHLDLSDLDQRANPCRATRGLECLTA